MLYQDLWAKSEPYHPLWCHLLDVAAVCEALLPRFGGVETLPTPWLLYLVALHDVGKADVHFQNKDPEQKARLAALGLELPEEVTKFRHEARSAKWLEAVLMQQGWGRQAVRTLCGAIRGHHGNFAAEVYDETQFPERLRQWQPLRQDLADLVRDVLQVPPYSRQDWQDAGAAGMKLSGLIVLADWIASNDEQYPYGDYARLNDQLPPEEYWRAAQREADIAARRLELTPPPAHTDEPAPAFNTLWPGFTLRPVQEALEKLCVAGLTPGLAIIEAPMGEGKTEAAIYLAEYWNRRTGRAGIYFALPTQATSNQMYGRYADYLQRTSPADAPRLVHGMSWLLDGIAPEETADTYGTDGAGRDDEPLSREWFRSAKRALLAPHGVGTVDQVLMAALNVKHGFLRFLGLSAKTLIVDEVHAYDAYMTTLLCRLLSWCRALNIPVILLSATLSLKQKRDLCEAYAGREVMPPQAAGELYPLLTFVPLGTGVGEPARTEGVPSDPTRDRTVALHARAGLLDEPAATAALAAAQVQGGGCACVVVNTVVAAQQTYQALKTMQERHELPSDTQFLLFHARFRAERRDEIERQVLRLFGKEAGTARPHRAILVATQVVEQSLDIDFDVMLSQIAPVDLLLQRSGRVWRHDHHPRHGHTGSALHILLPLAGSYQFGGSGRVYQPELLLRTLDLLRDRKDFRLPADFRTLIETCYGVTDAPASVPVDVFVEAVKKRQTDQVKAEGEADKHLIPNTDPSVFKLAQTSETVEEAEEGKKADFLHAQTRLGDDQSVAALVLHDPEQLALVKRGVAQPKAPPPRRERLQDLFWQKVNLPAKWLTEATAAPGFEIIAEGPKWLRHHIVLGFQGGVWQGDVKQGRDKRGPITIEDHAELGFLRQEINAAPEGDSDADV